MVHHVIYCQLHEGLEAKTLEEMVRASRTWLLKIPEVLSVRSGRNLSTDSQWHFFYSIEVDSREKLRMVMDNAYHLKFVQQYIQPHAHNQFAMDFELDPSRELKYS
ncbi:MAG: Dabb family protein [Armatimonadetes bacterium]|nr:Dabb family protein [Akkermansiaceae bacterium]